MQTQETIKNKQINDN